MRLIDLKMMALAIRCAQTGRQFAAEYGLTPTLRQRIGTAQPDDDDSDNPLAT